MNAPEKAAVSEAVKNLFIPVPKIVLPNGLEVKPFEVGTYLCSKGDDGQAIIGSDRAPWVNVNFEESKFALGETADMHLLTGTQSLAISWDIYNQDENWTGGKVGEGSLYQGLRKYTVHSAQPGTYESPDADERRWLVLSNGEKICDWTGNAFSWMRDDIHGDPETGLVNQVIPADSPYLTTAQHPSMEKGTGWRPKGPADWSGRALVRGGCFVSLGRAGVFCLSGGYPHLRRSFVGFRGTKPVSGS